MTIPEQIVRFLNQNPRIAFCDACIEGRCSVPGHEHAALVTATLELFPEFQRAIGQCSACGSSGGMTIFAL